jgi:flagellar assembly factor FliW
MPPSSRARIEDQPVSQAQLAAEIDFPDGLVGLPALTRHRLSPVPETALFEIVSNDDPTIGFIAAPVDDVRPGTTDRLRQRGLVGDGEWVLAILAVHGEPPAVTANLAGPLVINMEKATARQLVVEDPEFPLQAPVSEEG